MLMHHSLGGLGIWLSSLWDFIAELNTWLAAANNSQFVVEQTLLHECCVQRESHKWRRSHPSPATWCKIGQNESLPMSSWCKDDGIHAAACLFLRSSLSSHCIDFCWGPGLKLGGLAASLFEEHALLTKETMWCIAWDCVLITEQQRCHFCHTVKLAIRMHHLQQSWCQSNMFIITGLLTFETICAWQEPYHAKALHLAPRSCHFCFW